MEDYGKISVIVPVYNAEKYIRRCLENVSNQTYRNIECIIINDGSTDNSQKICADFCKIDGRFRQIDQKNSGLSASRNRGVQEAEGQFVFFLDSDDWLTMNALEILAEAIGDKKVCVGKHIAVRRERFLFRESMKKKTCKTISLEQAFDYALNTKSPYFFAWNKLFRREVFKEICFSDCLYEDIEIAFRLFSVCGSFVCVDAVTLFYNLCNSSSITSRDFSNKQMDCIKNAKRLIEEIEKSFPALHKSCGKYFAGANFHVFKRILSAKNSKSFSSELEAVVCNFKTYKKYLLFRERNMLKPIAKIIWFYWKLLFWGYVK